MVLACVSSTDFAVRVLMARRLVAEMWVDCGFVMWLWGSLSASTDLMVAVGEWTSETARKAGLVVCTLMRSPRLWLWVRLVQLLVEEREVTTRPGYRVVLCGLVGVVVDAARRV